MARFFGVVGFGIATENANGVWEDVIVEKSYYGDVTRNTRKLSDGDTVLGELSVNNLISIVADAYASEHFFAIRYIQWMGALWEISEVEVQSPRLLLRLGSVYNGPVPTT
jgi:hypothetical protein